MGWHRMIGLPDGDRKLIFAYDVEGYGKRGMRLAHATQQRLVDVLAYGFGQARLAAGTYETQEQGDGGITLLPLDGGATEPQLVTSLIGALDEGLAQVNEDLVAEARIRLRVAFDAGVVRRAANGYSGDAVVAACRLRDAEVVKDLLRDSPGDLVVVVADHLYRDIRADTRGRSFVQASVSAKELAATAWIYLPGGGSLGPAAPAPGGAGGKDTGEEGTGGAANGGKGTGGTGAEGKGADGKPAQRVQPSLSDAIKTNPGLW